MRNFSNIIILLFLIFVTADLLTGSAEAPALRLINNDQPIPVLMYHKVSPDYSNGGRGLRVSPQNFAWQMNYLKERGFTTITCEDLANYLEGEAALPQHPVLITFDDGYEDNYLYAFPIMKELGLKGTIFLVADQVGRYNTWDYDIGKQPYNKLMNWVQIKRMDSYGFEFGSHTLTHPHLTKVSSPAAEKEIIQSKIVLEEKLGKPVNTFAYPYGNYNGDIVEIVKKAGYRCAFTTRMAPVTRNCFPHELPRFRVTGFTTRAGFVSIVEGQELY